MRKKNIVKTTNPLEIRCNRVAKTIIRRALREDLRQRGDITTRATVISEKECSAEIICRNGGIIAGQSVAAEVFKSLEKSIYYNKLVQDGEKVESGARIASLNGRAWAVLAGERTALNILGRCSGIATLTGIYVAETADTGTKITETRKTAPGLRYLDKAAVVAGGGVNHRYGLHDAFLIKENHITAVGGIVEAIEACRAYAAKYGRFRIMVEAESFEDFLKAQGAGPDRILLDNMTPDEISRCISSRLEGIELEATGGITLDNIREYAETGVDYISIGALTHSVKVLDLSLIITA